MYGREAMTIRHNFSPDELRAFLVNDRLTAAYQLGDLDPAYEPFCSWHGYEHGGELATLFLLYTGLRIPVLLTLGDEAFVDPLLAALRDELPVRFHVHVLEEHQKALHRYYQYKSLSRMLRMGLVREEFQTTADTGRVIQLSHPDTAAIMELYHHYPDNFFDPSQLDTGMYFGIRDGNRIVSIAGIHVLSETDDIAAIGNLVTHRNYRRCGYGYLCTIRLLEELFEKVSLVALNVAESNTPAVFLYQKFGFRSHNVYYEGVVTRRGS